MEDIITSIIFFTSLILIVYILAKYNYLIKKMRIENGNPSTTSKNRYLEIGSIVLFIGIGMGFASYLPLSELPEDTMYLLVNSIIFICGGLGLVAAYFIRKRGGH